MRYRFSEFFIRKQATGGGLTVVTLGRLQLRYLSLVYDNTAAFKVEVTPLGRDTYTYEFTGRSVGDATNLADTVSIKDGIFKVPLMAKSQGLIVEIVNDTAFPSNLLSAEWTAMYVPKTKSV